MIVRDAVHFVCRLYVYVFWHRRFTYRHDGGSWFERVWSAPLISPFASVRPLSGHITIGAGTGVERGAEIQCRRGGAITIGRRSSINVGALLYTHGGDITIGDRCTVNPYCVLYGGGGLKVGNDVRIAASVVIIPGNHVFEDPEVPIARQYCIWRRNRG
jgi:carbonic anhydrase/acetyltransferase-like protein (isoleucine patch superfamily)